MRPLVVAVGDALRGDDAVGPEVLHRLARETAVDADLEVVRVPARLPSLWEGRDVVVIVDAVRSRDPAGTVLEVDPGAGSSPRPFGTTHGFGVGEVVALATELGQAPPTLRLIGVVGRRWGLGEPMSPDVADAVPEVVDAVRRFVASAMPGTGSGGEPGRRGRD